MMNRPSLELGLLLVLALLISTALAQPPGVVDNNSSTVIPPEVQAELDRCGGNNVVDAHLHEGMWFTTADPLLVEMSASGIAKGIIMAVYGPSNPFGTDPNEIIESLVSNHDRLFGLASLNTTGDDWESQKATELERLATYLEKPGFVGTKLAPPHTCLPLNSTIVDDILATVNASSRPVLGIHIGTTPFCGPFGDFVLGKRGCCDSAYVDPNFLEPAIAKYQDVTFVLMHSGQDFGFDPEIPFYNGTNFDHAIELAATHSNVYLEISANLARNATTLEYRNPLALENLVKIVDAGVQDKVVYGSDANQFPGGLLPYLNSTVVSLIAAGFTESERCQILMDNARIAYALDETETPSSTPQPGPVKEPPSSSYWIVYEGNAPDSCVVEDGDMVDEACCSDVGPLFGYIRDSFASTCFVIPGLLGDSGNSLQSFLGCDANDAMPVYGEACYNDGENGGLIPNGTVVEDTNATSIEECGCVFQVSGNGCHKIRDFSSLPGFENDTRQVFLFMNETCGEDTIDRPENTAAPADASTSVPAAQPVATPVAAPTSTSGAIDRPALFVWTMLFAAKIAIGVVLDVL